MVDKFRRITSLQLLAIQTWVEGGNRCCSIEFDNHMRTKAEKVWLYDYNESEGVLLKPDDDIPTVEDFRNKKRKSLQAQLDELNSSV